MKRPITGNIIIYAAGCAKSMAGGVFMRMGLVSQKRRIGRAVTLDRGRRAMSRGLLRSRRFTEEADRRAVTLSISQNALAKEG